MEKKYYFRVLIAYKTLSQMIAKSRHWKRGIRIHHQHSYTKTNVNANSLNRNNRMADGNLNV